MVAYPDPPLHTERIRLRPQAERDIPAIVAACQDPDMPRFLTDLPWPYGEPEARAWLASLAAQRDGGDIVDLAITNTTDDRMIGSIGASHLTSELRTASVGYWLAAEARGNGLMSEALRLLSRWLFTAVGIERIELTTAPDNLGSQRVARAAGFRLEGYARQEQRFARDGRRRDSLLFALLPGDLRASASSVPSRMVRTRRPRVVWLNGTFGAGKTSTANELKRRRPELTVYDPEDLGLFLREFVPVPSGDFQDLAEWREGVAAIGVSLARHRAATGVLAPMTLWRSEYLLEVFTAVRTAGVEVTHVLIDAPDEVLRSRIDADSASADSRAFRLDRLGDYSGARDFLRTAADVVVDTADLTVAQVADRVEPLLD